MSFNGKSGGTALDRGPEITVPSHTRRWFAVNTQPSSEARVCTNLSRQNWSAFCPQVVQTIRSGRRTQSLPRPLFPGYVFVSLDMRVDAWRSVDGTFGVRAIVKAGDTPSPLPTGLVESLKEMSDAQDCLVFTRELRVGEKVRFLSGPFAEMIGSLERLDSRGRVLVLLNLLGRQTEVKARAAELFPIRKQ